MTEKPTYEELEQRIRDLEQAESDRNVLEKAYHELERYCEAVQRIDQVSRSTGSAKQVLNKVTEEISQIFQCDRAWLLYPFHTV